MPAQSIGHSRRQMSRAEATAKRVLAGPAGENLALRALAPTFLASYGEFNTADTRATKAGVDTAKEVGEGEAALAKLRTIFDQTKEVVAAHTGISYEAASAYGAPEDLMNAAEEMEDLMTAGSEWAGPLLEVFSATVDEAGKEHGEASQARKAQQKAQLEREQAAGRARPVFVRFRRSVRAAFGSSSREYRELLDRRGRSDGPEEADNVAS